MARKPVAISAHTKPKTVNMEPIEVQTTSWAASCSSLPICSAIMALDTATGEPNKAISAGYSSGPQ